MVLAAPLLALAVAATPEGSAAWSGDPDVQALTESQRASLEEILGSTAAYGACKATLLVCGRAEPPDPLAVRLARFTAFMLRNGVDVADARRVIAARARFAAAPRRDFELEGRPFRGPASAPIVIVELADFECPYCRRVAPVVQDILLRSKGLVRHVYLHFPLKSHAHGVLAQEVAEAAHRQGKFWPLYDLLNVAPPDLDRETLISRAVMVGCDRAQLLQDLASGSVRGRVQADRSQGDAAGVVHTPTFFVDGRRLELAFHPRFVEDVVDEVAQDKGLEPPFWRSP